jgi:Sec-independent protein translocase protein TatA
MLNLDPAKLLIIAVVAVILLGPDKLPQVARQAGAAWRSLNDFRHRMESEVRSSIPDLPSSTEIARLARSPSALLNHLSNMSPDEPEAADGTNGTGVNGSNGADGLNGARTSADATGDESSVSGPLTESPVTGLPIVPPSAVPPSSMPPSSTIRPPTVFPPKRRPDVGAPGAGAGHDAGPGDPSLN